MLPYISQQMEAAHEKGTPVMRPMFYDFPQDDECWKVESEYMFGPDVLVVPVTEQNCRQVNVYLPAGAEWTNAWTGEKYSGGQWITADAPIEQIPLFTKDGFQLPVYD
jgi:alpha-D-xyloside xylohydrolase